MQQARTHRVGVSFDVQSFRYTGNQFIDVLEGKKDIEDVFYLRPVGYYTDRQGKNTIIHQSNEQQIWSGVWKQLNDIKLILRVECLKNTQEVKCLLTIASIL